MIMDKFERLIIRSDSDWKTILRTRGIRLCCPGCGETRPHGFEVHHIAGKKYGEESMPLCVICHRELTAWGEHEHPPRLEGPPSPDEKWGRFLIGLADVREMQTDLLRQIGEALISSGQSGGSLLKR
jgi:hypothetical protein